MFATVTLHYNEGDKMIAVPSSSIIFDRSKSYVLVFKDKYNIQVREVEPYKTSGGLAYLSKGLNPGEQVISRNQLLIYNALND
jgi:cobalt-zinc-cadmium efflux system membrane fusion protein